MERKSLRIAIDCDDVLVPTAHDSVVWYRAKYGVEVDESKYYSGTPEDWGVDDIRTASRRIEEGFQSTFFEDPPKPYPGAVTTIHKLATDHRLYLVTGRADFLLPVTERMVDDHFAGCFQDIIHTDHFMEGSRSKGSVYRGIGAHALIDDGYMHCESALDEGMVEAALLIRQPWNKEQSGLPRAKMYVCKDISDASRKIALLSGVGLG